MEKKFNKGGKKAAAFLKKNVYYILMAVCIIAVVTMVTVAAVNKGKDPVDVVTPPVEQPGVNPNPDPVPNPDDTGTITPPPAEPFVLGVPVAGGKFDQGFGDGLNSAMAPNKDGSWTVHLGLDYAAEEGASVFAAFKGVVKSVAEEPLMGTVITIEHQDGFVTVYKLLSEETNVTIGQTVAKGDVIGKVASIPESQEGIAATHLHFELLKDGTEVDPTAYMAEGDK